MIMNFNIHVLYVWTLDGCAYVTGCTECFLLVGYDVSRHALGGNLQFPYFSISFSIWL